MSQAPAVAVTGAGLVTACGLGLEPLAAALAAGSPHATPIDRLPEVPPRAGAATRAALVGRPGWEEWLPARTARRMSPPSIYAVVAARMALAGAGLPLPDEPDPDCGVLLATSFGASSFTQRMLDQILDEGPESISPFLFMESVANAPAGQVAIHARAGGPNVTVCQREAGPVAALGRAAAEVAAGRAARALAGATEEMTPLLFTALDRFAAVADVARPFDRRRRGFLAAEGATVLLVEAEAAARRRGTRLFARVRAWGGAFDPSAPRADWGSGGAALAASIARGMARQGIAPGDVDLVVSGASGARRGDRLEAALLGALFADRLPPVLAPKGVTGEYGGAYLAAALLALGGSPFAATAGFGEADPQLGLVPHDGSPLPPAGRVLVTGLAAGGAAYWVILEAPSD